LGDGLSCTSRATWLITELPGKYGCRGLVSRYNSCNILLVILLNCGCIEPFCYSDVVVGGLERNDTIIVPVVHEIDDEAETMRLSGLNDIVKALQAIFSGARKIGELASA
jgi:hypothetical protein